MDERPDEGREALSLVNLAPEPEGITEGWTGAVSTLCGKMTWVASGEGMCKNLLATSGGSKCVVSGERAHAKHSDLRRCPEGGKSAA